MSASIIDVAQRAGVSTATVSRALRGLPYVSEATRARVLQAAEELAYSVSPHAANLASGRTGSIGVVVPYVNRWFFGQVVAGIDSVLRAHDLDLLLYNLGDARAHERFFKRMPPRRRVDGLIVLNLVLSEPEIEALEALDVPVTVLHYKAPSFRSVRIDDADGATTAVRHLINLGHRRIGMILAAGSDPGVFAARFDRTRAYRAALEQAGIPHAACLETTCTYSLDDAASAMARLLTLPDPPTAVFAESDELAFGALRTLRRMGLRVPEDVSVIGFDDHESAHLLDLTTIAQPVIPQGALLARQILDALNGTENEPFDAIVPTRLVVRETTGTAAGSAREREEVPARPQRA